MAVKNRSLGTNLWRLYLLQILDWFLCLLVRTVNKSLPWWTRPQHPWAKGKHPLVRVGCFFVFCFLPWWQDISQVLSTTILKIKEYVKELLPTDCKWFISPYLTERLSFNHPYDLRVWQISWTPSVPVSVPWPIVSLQRKQAHASRHVLCLLGCPSHTSPSPLHTLLTGSPCTSPSRPHTP